MHFWVIILSFSRGTEKANLTGKIPFWTLIKKLFTPWATTIQMMTFMYPTVHRTFFEAQKCSFHMSPIKIFPWKMTIFTPFFSLLVWITYLRWILNPYKVYIFWRLHVLGIFSIWSYCSGVDTADVRIFTEYEKWNVTKILKCVLWRQNADRTIFPRSKTSIHHFSI